MMEWDDSTSSSQLDDSTGGETECPLASLLSSRPVLGPYQGPTLSQLANSALKLIAQCQDLTCLMSECGEEEVDPSWLVDHVKSQMLFRPSLSGFTLLEVMESLLCQKASSCLESDDWKGLLRLSRLVIKLGPKVGLDMTGVLEERQSVRKEVTSAEVSWALHQSGLLSLESQWKCLSKANMERYLSDILEQSQVDREVGAGIVRAGMSLVVSESRTALTLVKFLLLYSRDSEREFRFDWLEIPDKKWAQLGLETVLSQQERGDLKEAVKNHRAWQTSTDRGPGSLILALVRSGGQSDSVYRQEEVTILYWPKNIYPIFPKKDPKNLSFKTQITSFFLIKTQFLWPSGTQIT